MTDTDLATQAVQIAAARRLSPSQRATLAAEMSTLSREISMEGERRRHPELTVDEARDVVASRTWGTDLARRVRERRACGR